ncbi:MAG: hypothetical protein GF334_02700 [Candidatus Altiarchaeales archaeon]|nr:hypothetical protein [Candidatus Altiarchaeales archaeon]
MTIKSDLLHASRDLYAVLGGNELDRDREAQAVRGSTTAGEFEDYMYKKKLARNHLSDFIDYVESRKRISRRDAAVLRKKLEGLFVAQKNRKLGEVTEFFEALDGIFRSDEFTAHQKNLLGECEAAPQVAEVAAPLDSGDFMEEEIDQAIEDAGIEVKPGGHESLLEPGKYDFTHAWHILLLIAISTILFYFFTLLFSMP